MFSGDKNFHPSTTEIFLTRMPGAGMTTTGRPHPLLPLTRSPPTVPRRRPADHPLSAGDVARVLRAASRRSSLLRITVRAERVPTGAGPVCRRRRRRHATFVAGRPTTDAAAGKSKSPIFLLHVSLYCRSAPVEFSALFRPSLDPETITGGSSAHAAELTSPPRSPGTRRIRIFIWALSENASSGRTRRR